MVSIVPMQRRTDQASPAAAAAAVSFSLERLRREEDEARGGGSMDLSSAQGELPIPMHAPASPYASGGSAGGRVLQQLHRERGNNKGNEESPVRLPPSPPAASEDRGSGKKRAAGGGGSGVKYRECLKNHAAAMGGNATDGCGEFMPSGEEGSLEALKCSACGCHRNFHRKEVDDDDEDLNADVCTGHGHRAGRRLLAPAMPPHLKSGGAGGGLLVTADPYGVGAYAAMRAVPPPPPLHHHHHQQFVNAMPLSAVHTSEESDGMDGGAGARGSSSSLLSKKRFRTKFTAEQKARMLDFAERVGWRLQKLDDGMVHAFCQEIGVKRRVLKVWMHNNKHSLATKRLEAPPEMASAPAPPPPMPMVPPPPMQIVPPPPPALPSSPQPGPSFHLGGPSSQPPQHMAMPMVPPPPPPPFHHRGPSSPAPLKLD